MDLKYFFLSEFRCPCGCRGNEIKTPFVYRLDSARHIAGVPFKINSGYRCKNHNKHVGGSPSSSHLRGVAADIACTDSLLRMKIFRALMAEGFRRIGIGKDFIHVDDDRAKVRDVIWLY